MISLFIILCAIIVIAVIGFIAAVIAGGGFLLWFGDVIVFCLIVWIIIKLIERIMKK